ncbi:MAG: ring-opening amidohydrolase [Betaproteobacteria bacterium]|nr:ring-opening amidohydrolase [Betaproteobacteria bacterium]
MSAQRVDVHRITMRGPGDVSGLASLLGTGGLRAEHVVAILGKTEGNGGVNDFTREYACRAFAQALAPGLGCAPGEVEARIAMVMSGGTEGVLSPHATVFSRRPGGSPAGAKRLAVGVAQTRDFLPEELGRAPQIHETARAVRAAMKDAGLEDAADVHFVQVKCPLLTSERVEAALARGNRTITDEAYASMGYSRGASALGVAVALGEIDERVHEDAVLADWRLFSAVASTSAGIELLHNAVVVMGNSAASESACVIGHAVMRDAIDLRAVQDAFASVGLDASRGLDAAAAERVVNVFAKAEASPDGLVRGLRHTMLDDTDISATRHARAAVGGLIAGVAGCGAVYVSGGAEHQGPAGGGPIAVIARAG